jgi:hypothetical protein
MQWIAAELLEDEEEPRPTLTNQGWGTLRLTETWRQVEFLALDRIAGNCRPNHPDHLPTGRRNRT